MDNVPHGQGFRLPEPLIWVIQANIHAKHPNVRKHFDPDRRADDTKQAAQYGSELVQPKLVWFYGKW